MTRFRLRCPAAGLTCLLPLLCQADPGFFVEAQGTVESSALVDAPSASTAFTTDSDTKQVNSGILNQTSYGTGTSHTSATGTNYKQGIGLVAQSAAASLIGNASIGALHGVALASSETSGISSANATQARVYPMTLEWSDTVIFHSSNPQGSNFDLGLTLDDLISESYDPNGSGFIAGVVQATLALTKVGLAPQIFMNIPVVPGPLDGADVALEVLDRIGPLTRSAPQYSLDDRARIRCRGRVLTAGSQHATSDRRRCRPWQCAG